MSAPVDVLAVLEAVDGILNSPVAVRRAELVRQQAAIREARDAVAELIKADKEYDAIRERRNLYPCPGMDEHFVAATKRRAAALARVQGGAA